MERDAPRFKPRILSTNCRHRSLGGLYGRGVGSGYSINYTGSYQNFAHVYVSSGGYVTVRLNAGSYKGYWLDLFQAGHYPIRNINVSAATFSNSATL